MDRLKGLPAFALIAAVVLIGLRLVHVAVPVVFPQTRQGPIAIASLDDVRGKVGFAPLIPAYRPESLGFEPASISVALGPHPTFVIVWSKDDQYLSITQRRGGPRPIHPPLAPPLAGVPDSTWWTAGSRTHLVLERDGFWIEIETSLTPRDLRRFADTLEAY
jgi:hypothetical protein